MREGTARILVVDDERSMQEFLEIFLRREGYDVVTAGDVDTAVAHLEADEIDLVITDMQMPEKTGLDLLLEAREVHADAREDRPRPLARGTRGLARNDLDRRHGLWDDRQRHRSDEGRRVRLFDETLQGRRAAHRHREGPREEGPFEREPSIATGASQPGAWSKYHRPQQRDAGGLRAHRAGCRDQDEVSGESGTGKELVARAIHEQSPRNDKPFVAINCGAIPENLLESELFGHTKGAFTGAVQTKQGLFEAASGGTLFLDEVAELSQPLQVKLLRALQERTIRRVGDTVDRKVDVRIVSATNRRLEDEVAAGRFREDVYYRLNVIELELPPLRDRIEDIPLLAQHFIRVFAEELGKDVEGLDASAYEVLSGYAFPGNVRELENLIERAVALTHDPIIGRDLLPPSVTETRETPCTAVITEEGVNLEELVADYERRLLREALVLSKGVKKKAARLLGVSFRSFRYRLEKLEVEDSKRGD